MPQGAHVKRLKERRTIEQRTEIVAQLWRKNWTYTEIRKEVMRRLNLPTYSLQTVHADVQRLLKEWQTARLDNTEDKIMAELARLDLVIREAWEMWEKSKEDYHRRSQQQTGIPKTDTQGVAVGMTTLKAMMHDAEKRGEGEPRYLDIIIKALAQRCKLLGLDRIALDVSGGMQDELIIKYVGENIPCATSEEEVMRREGLLKDDT